MGKFKDLLERYDVLILHGALGTELEALGYDISGKLWSAKYLMKEAAIIQKIHETYIAAGADLITSSSYQATIPGLMEAGLSQEEATTMIAETISLAKKARESVWSQLSDQEKAKRPYPLVSGDVGPYAAYLANGSEYTGDYGQISFDDLKNFHRPRIEILLREGADLLALETIPNALEAQALVELLADEFPDVEAYLSFTIQDNASISDGTSFEDICKIINDSKQILALGINCSSPLLYDVALEKIRSLTNKYLVTYPNSGEIYDGCTQTWKAKDIDAKNLVEHSQFWQKQFQVKILGGCCRTRPNDIKDLYQTFRN